MLLLLHSESKHVSERNILQRNNTLCLTKSTICNLGNFFRTAEPLASPPVSADEESKEVSTGERNPVSVGPTKHLFALVRHKIRGAAVFGGEKVRISGRMLPQEVQATGCHIRV